MGLFDFFKRRADRESAIPQSSIEDAQKPDDRPVPSPVGQQFDTVGQQPGFDGQLSSLADVTSVLGLVGKAMASGNIQVQQGDSQTIDLRGTDLGEEIREAMRRHGIDPEAAASGEQVDAGAYLAFQQELLEKLGQHGIDADGDGSR